MVIKNNAWVDAFKILEPLAEGKIMNQDLRIMLQNKVVWDKEDDSDERRENDAEGGRL